MAWEPGVHCAQRFWLAMAPAAPSTLDVRFARYSAAVGGA